MRTIKINNAKLNFTRPSESYDIIYLKGLQHNQHDYKKHPKKYGATKLTVKIFFSQLCDQMHLKGIMQNIIWDWKQD